VTNATTNGLTKLLSIAWAVALVAATPTFAQPIARLVAAQSEIGFVSTQMGVPVEGRFARFETLVALDPNAPETGRVTVTIDIGSAALGVADADAELPKPPWFDAGRFPQARFESTTIKALGGGRFEVTGRLAIKGATRDVVVPVAITQSASVSTASGSFSIKRLDFRVGDGEWADTALVANDVRIRFKLVLSGLPPL